MNNNKNGGARSSGILKVALIAIVSVIVFGIGYSAWQIHLLSDKQERIKKDYMVVNSVSFGLLSVDEWRENIIAAAKSRIEEFKLSPQQNQDLKLEIEQILHSLIDKAVAQMDKPKKSIGGKITKLAFKTFVHKKDLHEQVPNYAQKIIDEINKPSSYRKLKNIATEEVDSLGSKIYDSSKIAEKKIMDSIFGKYTGVTDRASFEKKSAADLDIVARQQHQWAYTMLAGVIIILVFWWLVRNKPDLHTPLYILSIISALVLLVVGLTTTMIQVDARIQSIDFHLLGRDISFRNQVLYFQSKSIVDVVEILIRTGRIDSMLVGVLILVFSIVFPITKLVSTGIYMLDKRKWAKNKWIHFFAFDSSRWSMADVLVIAILMTYIGFNGIVNNSLSDLDLDNGTITSIATNNTAIQPGYIIFIGFVVYSFILSSILKNITHLRNIIIVDRK
jgi:Paraquat-inducible protein A